MSIIAFTSPNLTHLTLLAAEQGEVKKFRTAAGHQLLLVVQAEEATSLQERAVQAGIEVQQVSLEGAEELPAPEVDFHGTL